MEEQLPRYTQQIPASKSNPTKPSNNWLKTFLIIVLLLIVLIAAVFIGIQIGRKQGGEDEQGGGGLPTPTTIAPTVITITPTITPTPTPNPTADWKTYINEKEKYSFKYPSDWEMSSTVRTEPGYNPIETTTVTLKRIDKTQEKVLMPGDTTEDATYWIYISSQWNESSMTAKDFYLWHLNLDTASRQLAEKNLGEVIIAGEKGIRYASGSAPGGPGKTVFITHKDLFYKFVYASPRAETALKFYDEFDQILSTFKFTE